MWSVTSTSVSWSGCDRRGVVRRERDQIHRRQRRHAREFVLTKRKETTGQCLAIEDCPFCGSVEFSNNHVGGRHYIVCTSCGTIGPKTDDSDNAIRLWNMRNGVLS
jgi:Lar family restriction alleviation protein